MGNEMSDAPKPLGSRIVRSATVVCSRTDRTVLVDLGTGWRTTLDDFGSWVWMQLDEQPTLAVLVMRLRDDGMLAERLAEDVARLLARWRATRMITWR